VALRKDFAPAWLNRGLAYARLRFHPLARDDFDRAIDLDPTLAEAYVQRALLRDATGDRAGAVEDFSQALKTGAASPRVYFLRASVRRKLKDPIGAGADVRAGFEVECNDELGWVARSEVRLAAADAFAAAGGVAAATPAVRTRALADVEEALAVNPGSMFGLQQKAHILAEQLARPGEAVVVLDRLVGLYPDSAPAVAGRGVVLARAGKRGAALRDAKAALLLDGKAPNLYQVGCVYALTSRQDPDDKREAFRLLWGGLKTGFGLDLVDHDPDLDPVRADPAFKELVKRARLRAELGR
jgi:tetratricopeptide (TPR) repeat protein